LRFFPFRRSRFARPPLFRKKEEKKLNLFPLFSLFSLYSVSLALPLTTVQRPREHAEDAEAFGVIAQRGLESSRLLAAGGKSRTPRALAARLKAAFGLSAAPAAGGGGGSSCANNASNAGIDWNPLARLASSLFRVAPGLSCALGPLDAPRKKAIARAQYRRQATPPPVAAPTVRGGGGGGGDDQNGVGVGEGQEDGPAQETDRRMEAMLAELVSAARRAANAANAANANSSSSSSSGSVRAIEAILDHSSFATTVENLFALSFLIRDGFVALTDSSDGYRVKAVKKSSSAKRENANNHDNAPSSPGGGAGDNPNQKQQQKQHRQLVLAYSPADFEEWKRAVNPRDCLMPRHQASLSGNAVPAAAAAAAAAAAVSARVPAAVGTAAAAAAAAAAASRGGGGASRPPAQTPATATRPPPPQSLLSPTQLVRRGPPAPAPAPAPGASKKRRSSADVSDDDDDDSGDEDEDSPVKKKVARGGGGGGGGIGGPRKSGKGGPLLPPRPARRT